MSHQHNAPAGNLPAAELALRRRRCREILAARLPAAGGLLLFSSVNIYYLTGTLAIGLLWLPLEGEPALAVRKGEGRAAIECPGLATVRYRSFADLPALLAGAGSPLRKCFGLDEASISLSMGRSLLKNLPGYELLPADNVMARARAVKTPLELEIMRRAGRLHYECACLRLPERIRPGQTEDGIAREQAKIFLEAGHMGHARMNGVGEEFCFAKVSVGDNGNYPLYSTGPLGTKGMHPAAPFMGDINSIWQPGGFLSVDSGFALEGYVTDKTQLYFAGREADLPARARKAQDCVMRVQAELAARLKPGNTPEELYELALQMVKKDGFDGEFMGLGADRQPFVGHGIGLHMDEWPPLARRFADPLQENMLICLEPKIGVPGLCMAGTENTFLVTPDGGQSLTGAGPDIAAEGSGIICIEI